MNETGDVADGPGLPRFADALRESEARSRALASASFDVVYRMSPDWTEMLWGQDFTAGTLEPSPSGVDKSIHPDQQPGVMAKIQRAIRTKSTFELEHRVTRADGTLGWTHSRAIPMLDADGRLVEWIVAARDITQRKQAEEVLRESEARFRALTNATFDVVYRMSADWTEMRCFEGRDFIADTLEPSRSWLDKYIHPDDQPLLREAIQRAVQAKSTFELEHRIVRADGTLGWTHSRAIPILDARGEIVEWFGAASDVTRRKQAEAALEQRAAQHAAIAELGKTALAETSIDELMDRVVHCVAHMLRTELATVLELAPGGGALLLRAGVGWKPGLVGRATVGAGSDSQAGFTLLADRPVVVTDLRTETRFTGPPLLRDHDVVSGMSCVIRGSDGRPYGVLSTHTRGRREFSGDDVNFLRSVANVLAAAIGRRRAEEALREAESRGAAEAAALARLNELTLRLWRMPGLNEGLKEMLRATGALLGADMGSIQLMEGRVLRMVAQRGLSPAFLEHFREVTVEDDSACARALRSGAAVMIEDVETDEGFAPLRPLAREAGYRAVVSTPLIGHYQDTLGMVSVHFTSPHRPSDQDLQRLTLYVRQAADFIARCRAEGALRESEARQACLVRLDDALRPLADAGAIQNAAARVLGEHLRVTRAMYADVDGEPGAEVATIRSRYHGPDGQALASFPERFAYRDFGERVMALRRRGDTIVVADVNTDPAFDASERAAWVANGVRAGITASLVKVGRMVAVLAVHSASPRSWTAQETALVEATAERTWAAVERARAEAALRESEERFRTLADNMDQLAWMADARGTFLWFNKRWHDDIGATVEEFNAANWRLVHPEHAPRVAERSERCLRQGEAWEDTFPLKGRTGEYRWFLCRAVPIKDDEGRLLRWFGTMTDITELEQRNAQLQRLSAQLTAIEQHERRKLATTLHDGLQQLIVAAKLRLPLCLEENGSEQMQGIDRLLDEAIQAVRSLAWELSPPALGISTLLEALEWLADWFHSLHGFHMRILAPEAIPPLPEPAKLLLFGAVREMLLNCVKHSGVNAATLELRTDAARGLQMVIADNGAGFDPAKLTYGFGLSSIRERLVALGGRLIIESAPGMGARFTILLPAAQTKRGSLVETVPGAKAQHLRVSESPASGRGPQSP